MRIGLFGGTFDPPHNGHLALAEDAKIKFNLDEVWFIPAGDPYFKTAVREVTHPYKRMNMVNAAIQGVDWAISDDCEVCRQGPSYTDITLKHYLELYPQHKFYLILGADELRDITAWHNFQYLFDNCTIIAAHRDAERGDEIFRISAMELMDKYGAKILFLPFNIPISSTQIREKIRVGASYRFYLPPATYDYIRKHGLYGVDKDGHVHDKGEK